MPGRRMLLLMILLLLGLSVLSATRNISRREPAGGSATTTTGTSTAPPARTETKPQAESAPARTADRVTATLPSSRTVRVTVGERVALKVKSERPEIAVVDGLGLRAPVGPGTSGILDFVAPERGTFPVTFGIDGRSIGEITVGR